MAVLISISRSNKLLRFMGKGLHVFYFFEIVENHETEFKINPEN